jgi:hypothetical protein
MSQQKWEEYRGSLTLPGENAPRNISVSLDTESKAVRIYLDEPIEGVTEWEGQSVQVNHRLKYNEIMFMTSGLPRETIELTWKFNTSLLDDSLAGVVIARPNDLRITGEKGFILSKPSGNS